MPATLSPRKSETILRHWSAAQLRYLQTVADAYGMSIATLLQPRRPQHIALARHVCMYLLHDVHGLTYVRVAELFCRDHTTVVYGVERIKQRCAADGDFRRFIELTSASLRTADAAGVAS